MSTFITGSLINAFYICPRKAWLMAHEFGPEPDNVYIEIGKLLVKEAYKREKKEIVFENMKVDLIKRRDGDTIIGEVKKSSRGQKAGMMQLAYYLYRLRQYGISAKGELLIPKEKRKFTMELTDELMEKVKNAIAEIRQVINKEQPPSPEKVSFCSNCAYREFCWV